MLSKNLCDIANLYKIIGYKFKDAELLSRALTHSAVGDKNYERMEFLGDSILGFVVSESIYGKFPNLNEGELTKFRASIVCEATLFEVSENLGLADYVNFGKSLAELGAREKESIMADVIEAVIAAIYFDSGLDAARRFIMGCMTEIVERDYGSFLKNDSKSYLQEAIQRTKKTTVSYELIQTKGPDHDKTFTMNVLCNGRVVGYGEGKSKKLAEMAAAQDAIDKMRL